MQRKQREPESSTQYSQTGAPVARRIQTNTMVLADMLTLAYVLKQKYQQSSRQDSKAAKVPQNHAR